MNNKNKPILLAVASVCMVVGVVLAAMNLFGGAEPGTSLPPDKTDAAAAAASPTAITPVNKNMMPQLPAGQFGGRRSSQDGK